MSGRCKIVECGKEDYAVLAGIWENSVRATHLFLTDDAIEEIKSQLIPAYFPNVDLYAVADGGSLTGFIGLSGRTIEMLFIDAGRRGCGYGSMLIDFARSKGADRVDVNEQNTQALGFYLSKGFRVIGRDETDEAGRPYPILHMLLNLTEK